MTSDQAQQILLWIVVCLVIFWIVCAIAVFGLILWDEYRNRSNTAEANPEYNGDRGAGRPRM